MVGAMNMCQALSRLGSRKSAVSPCASCDLARCNIEVNDRILSRAGRATAGVKTVRYSRAFQAGRQHAAAAAILAPHGAQYLPNGAGPGRPPTRRWRISQCASSVARAGPSICMGPPDRARRQGPVVKAVHSNPTAMGGPRRGHEASFRQNAKAVPTYCQPDGRGSERSGRHAVGHWLRLLDAIAALCADALPMTTPSCATIRTDRDDQPLRNAERRYATIGTGSTNAT